MEQHRHTATPRQELGRLNRLKKKQENQAKPKLKEEGNPLVLPWFLIFDEHMKLGPANVSSMNGL